MRKCLLFLSMGCLLQQAALLAQYGAGVLLGTVADASGAVVPGVKVTAKNNATNEVRSFATDAAGDFRFTALPSGTYTLTAAASSFKTATVSGVELRVNTQVRVDISMQLGVVTETVQVAATTPQLQTNTAALGTVIDRRTMLELPLNARNFFDLLALTPGTLKVVGGSTVMDGRTAEIGGVRSTSTNAMLDGVDFSVINLNNPAIALSLDAIEEFKVQMNFMDASYGHGAAGIDMVTRRGTNAFHGTLYDFVRNRAFQAGQFFRPPQGAPRFTYNQFGGSAGGAIVKNRTFYFGNYEGRRSRTGVILQGFVPTAEMFAGDFSATGKIIRDPFNNNQPFAGSLVPKSRVDPISQKLLQYFPLPNFVNRRAGVNFLVTPSDSERRDQFTGRIDHRISDRGSLFGRYSFADDAIVNAAYRTNRGQLRPDRSQNLAIGYTHLFSSHLIGESRAGFTKAYLARGGAGDLLSTNFVQQLGIKNLVPAAGDYTEPSINLTGYAPGIPTDGPGGFGGYGGRGFQNNLYYRIGETVTYIRDRHNLKIGGDVSRLMGGFRDAINQDGLFSFSGNYAGDAFADFLLGLPLTASGSLGSLGNFGGVAKYSIGTQFQWFVQDDWKVTNRLTLNLGLRHELFLPWRGRLANFDLASGRQLLAGRADYYIPGRGLVSGSGPPLLPERPERTDKNNFAPRLGIAYRLGAKSTIRLGTGIFYTLNGSSAALSRMTVTVPFLVSVNLTSSPTTPELSLSNLFPAPEATSASLSGNVDRNRRTGYLHAYNLNIQHQVRPGLLFETGYLGNTGQKQEGMVLVNQPRLPADPAKPEPFSARQPFPSLVPGFNQTTNYQWSNYYALFFKIEQRATHDLSYTVAYTYSKTIDSGGAGQNMYNRRPERELAANDVRHNFIASYVYELPLGRGRKFNIRSKVLDGVVGGWQIGGISNFRSGMAFSIGTANDLANVGTGGQRANATGVKPTKLDPRTNNLRGFDTSAYSVPARGTFGNLAPNVQPGFGINNWDFSAMKNFAIRGLGESSRVQIRAEWFNFFNHTQFRNPGSTANVPVTFGIVNGALDPRILQLAAKLYW